MSRLYDPSIRTHLSSIRLAFIMSWSMLRSLFYKSLPVRPHVKPPAGRQTSSKIVAALLLILSAASSQASDYDITQFRPATLHYQASKFFISAQTTIRQRVLPTEQAVHQLIPISQGEALMPAREQVILQTIETDALGLKSTIEVWLNPDASILQRTSLYTGRKNWFRTYRYIPAGAYSVKRLPKNRSEQKLPHSQWTDVDTDYYQLETLDLKQPLSEPEALFYLISVAKLEQQGDEIILPVFDKDEVIEVRVSVEGRSTRPVSYTEKTADGSRKISGRRDLIQARLSARPLNPETDTSDFQFLGYNGDVELYIDPERRVIVQMTGEYDYLGSVDIRLNEVDYR